VMSKRWTGNKCECGENRLKSIRRSSRTVQDDVGKTMVVSLSYY